MLHKLLHQYLFDIEQAVSSLDRVYVEKYEEEALSSTRINLRIRIRFQAGYLVEVNEALIVDNDEIQHLNYRYHFQDRNNKIVFRYDNTPHFPNLDSFPHHKHLELEVIPSEKPTVLFFIEEINNFITNNL